MCRADGFVSQEEFETTLKKMDEKVRQIEPRDGEFVRYFYECSSGK